MDQPIKVSFRTTISTVKESTNGLMGGNSKENGKIIKWKARESSLGRTAENTSEIMWMTKNTVMESLFGLKGRFTKVTGLTENSTAWVCIWAQTR